MTNRVIHPKVFVVLGICLLVSGLLVSVAAAQGPPIFACTGEAFIVQRLDAQLFQIDQTLTPFEFQPVGPNADLSCDPLEACNLVDGMGNPIEANNMGFRSTDGQLYAVQLTAGGNAGIISIDANADVTFLGVPGGLAFATTRTDSGDVSADGSTMYVNQAGSGRLWIVDLTTFMVTDNPVISGAAGAVNDWAFNPGDGNLYGGDQTDGQVAQLDLGSIGGGMITRADFNPAGCAPLGPTCDVSSLPSGIAYGGAWFNAAGLLHLYQNGISGNADDFDGKLFVVDLGLNQIVRTQSGRDSEGRNDGAACIPDPPYGVAKSMTANPTDALPSTVTIQYVFENLGDPMNSPAEDLINLSAIDDLAAVFGVHGVDWTFTSIVSAPAGFANPGFDGHTDTELVNQAPNQDLLAGELKTMTVEIQVLTLDFTNPPPSTFCNQVVALAENSLGILIGDLSTDGGDPDPDGDGFPDERELSCIDIIPPPCLDLVKVGALDLGPDGIANPGDVIDYTFDVSNCGGVAVTGIDVTDLMMPPTVSPITCPSGNPIPSLDVGESEICTGSYVITQADVDSCSVFNTASADGMAPTGAPVSATDNHTEPIPPVPDIQLTKSGVLDDGGDGTADVGDIIDYVVTVQNLGNVTLMNVSVTDPIVSPIVCPSGNPIPSLAPGAMEVCTGSYVVTQADLDAGQRCNTASVTGTQPTTCGPGTAADDDTICIPLSPPSEIPTLGHLGLLFLALGLGGLGVRRLRRQG